MLKIKTLGNLAISENKKPLDTLFSLRAKVLLTYLALEGGSHHRNYLAAMFWPESSEEKALTSLRVVLSELRKVVGNYLEIHRTNVGVQADSPIELDVAELEVSLKTGKTDHALSIYRGDFLTGIYIPDSIEFENWCRWESERVRNLIVEHLENDIKNKISLGEYLQAADLSRNLLKIHPLNETGHQHYAIALALSGNRSGAIEHIKSFKQIFADELGIEPSLEFGDVEHWISRGDLGSLELKIKPPTNLPAHQSSFVGRADPLAELTALINDPSCRLITIIGPGGIGKTRLAIKSAQTIFHHFPDGSFFVPLESVTSSLGIYQAIAEAMDFKFDSIVDLISPLNQLTDVIGDQKIIFILDGFEHLTQEGYQISTLIRTAPHIKFLVTSRHKLNIPDEWVYLLEGMELSVPDPDSSKDLPEAFDLFIRRVEQHQPGFTFSTDEITFISRICSLVEGHPLAIELAAGWSSVLSFSEIASEIANTFEFLDNQSKTGINYQNIKAVFTSSWNLLEHSQQVIMARLSVFRGSFSHQAAIKITGATLTDLSTLVDKSMLRKNQAGKFEIHAVIREYLQDILDDQPKEREDLHQKHFEYYSNFLSIRVPDMGKLNKDCTHKEIRYELSNIQAAAEYAALYLDIGQNQEIIKNLYSYYIIHGWYEGALAFDKVAELLDEYKLDSRVDYSLRMAKIQAQKGFFYSNLGLLEESEEICQFALPILEQAEELRELAICIQNLGINAIFRGEYEQASNLLDRAINISKKTSCSSFPSFYLWVGYLHFMLGTYQEGMDNLIISLELFEKDNNDRATAFSLSKMGLAQDALGNHQDASQYHEKSLAIFRESDNQAGIGYALSRMSLGSILLDDFKSALEYGEHAYTEFMEIGHRWGKCASLTRIAFAKMGLGNLIQARELFLDAIKIAHEHQLNPLCLHAIAGIACLKSLTDSKQEALSLMSFVQQHPKTPEIYQAVHKKWLKTYDKRVIRQNNSGLELELGTIARQILDGNN